MQILYSGLCQSRRTMKQQGFHENSFLFCMMLNSSLAKSLTGLFLRSGMRTSFLVTRRQVVLLCLRNSMNAEESSGALHHGDILQRTILDWRARSFAGLLLESLFQSSM